MEPLIIIGFVLLAVGIRLIAGAFDGQRVERYIRKRGWRLLDKRWAPFGPGWFGTKGARLYEIVYRDRGGRVHRAHVKTSMLSGVYLTNDRIVQEAPKRSIEDEKTVLRKRLVELERRERAENATRIKQG